MQNRFLFNSNVNHVHHSSLPISVKFLLGCIKSRNLACRNRTDLLRPLMEKLFPHFQTLFYLRSILLPLIQMMRLTSLCSFDSFLLCYCTGYTQTNVQTAVSPLKHLSSKIYDKCFQHSYTKIFKNKTHISFYCLFAYVMGLIKSRNRQHIEFELLSVFLFCVAFIL